MPAHMARTFLQQMKWNHEKLAEFYYEVRLLPHLLLFVAFPLVSNLTQTTTGPG